MAGDGSIVAVLCACATTEVNTTIGGLEWRVQLLTLICDHVVCNAMF
jgi:hypothetical protein